MRRIDGQLPQDWVEAAALCHSAKRAGFRTLLAAHGHRALLTVASLVSGLGSPWPTASGQAFGLDGDALAHAIGLYDEMLHLTDRALSLASTAIDVRDRLATENDIAFCPAAYGYATYGESGAYPTRLGFFAFPGAGPAPWAGTAIGGAGLGISAASPCKAAAADYLAYQSGGEVQCEVFAAEAGQPARLEAWTDPAIVDRFNRFFSSVHGTVAEAWVRPRLSGYTLLEQGLAALLQEHLHGRTDLDHCARAMCARAEQTGLIP